MVCKECFEGGGWGCPFCHAAPEVAGRYKIFSPENAASNEGFQPDYFERLVAVEAGNFWFRSRNQLITWGLGKYFPDARNFFEIGCGTGFVLSGIKKAFPRLSLCGSDIYLSGIEFAGRRIEGVDLFQMDARHIPFADEFDVIGAFDILEHIKDDELVLSEMYRAVHRGGGVMLTVPQHSFLWSHADEYACHVRRYNQRELRAKVERAGFKIIKMTSFTSLLLPLLMISRLRRRRLDTGYAILSELKLKGPLNGIFEKVLGLERGMIRLGVPMPIGGSLFLMASKT